jgi:amino acid transporter
MNDAAANVAASASVTSLSIAWFAQANEVLQFVALIVTIVTGAFAIRHYYLSHRKP